MLSSSEARYTGLAITAHVRADFSGNIRKTWLWTVFLKIFFEAEVKEILYWSLNKKKHYSRLFFSTAYGKSLIYQMLPSLFDKITARNLSSKNKSIVLDDDDDDDETFI